MLYYFGPILVMLAINTFLSVITAKTIYIENKKNRSVWKKSQSHTNVTNQAKYGFLFHMSVMHIQLVKVHTTIFVLAYSFGMFFRMFAISGVIWAFELIAYILHTGKNKNNELVLFETIFLKEKDDETVIDFITCSSGILLFFVTIWKKDVLESISKR